ncbi:MAG: hypothetical protein HQM11_07465 [SAR324 cluster bacterium]|nr:hypothetical protein [SAR324 cluster bacterium]
MKKSQLHYFASQVESFAERHRLLSSFIMVLFLLVVTDEIFHLWLFPHYVHLLEHLFFIKPEHLNMVDLGYAPEVWLSLLGTVLGTLIIVISIASQSIPKLIDLYMEDRPSLFYVWFLILSVGHAIFVKIYAEIGIDRQSSRILNIHFMLTFSAIVAFPYIFYILKYTKPSNVINRILSSQGLMLNSLTQPRLEALLDIPKMVEEYQYWLFESMNQLDDLLEYVAFREPKADIIQGINNNLSQYIPLKKQINPAFFKVSPRVRSDISFKTMIGQFGDMEKSGTFLEQKCFRLLGNVYIKLIERGEFDLASLCASQMTMIGKAAVEAGDDALLDTIIIRLNTILRFAIKHGVKNNEGRNLYNAAFHYGNFIEHLVRSSKLDHVKRCFMYLRIYGTEIFKHGRSAPAMYFIVDVFASEMKKILILVYSQKWAPEVQEGLLKEMLMVDNPPDFNKEDLDRGVLMNNGVRVLQIGLALFYLREGVNDFVQKIVVDVLDDLSFMGENVFQRVIDMTMNRLKFSGPTFWEDTDRGNLNIYYTPDQNQIDTFKEWLGREMALSLKRDATKKYLLEPVEVDMLWEMANKGPKQELMQLAQQPVLFEKCQTLLENLDADRINALVSLRNKLYFTSDNPNLTITHTRQIALQSVLEIMMTDQLKQVQHKRARVIFSYPDHLFIEFIENKENLTDFVKAKQLTIQLKSLRQNLIYQFKSHIVGPSVENLFKMPHTDHVKIISSL